MVKPIFRPDPKPPRSIVGDRVHDAIWISRIQRHNGKPVQGSVILCQYARIQACPHTATGVGVQTLDEIVGEDGSPGALNDIGAKAIAVPASQPGGCPNPQESVPILCSGIHLGIRKSILGAQMIEYLARQRRPRLNPGGSACCSIGLAPAKKKSKQQSELADRSARHVYLNHRVWNEDKTNFAQGQFSRFKPLAET